jgi:hypothetical protein
VTSPLEASIAQGLSRDVAPEISQLAARLAAPANACAALFYGSNLRTGSLDGIVDYYLLTLGAPERGIWPRVSYHEEHVGGRLLRAKVARMSLAKFAEAATGMLLDTTIWARFVQPSALVWHADAGSRSAVIDAIAAATATASRLAAVLGPDEAREEEYWVALFRATYRAEFRIETNDRARSVYELNREHFTGLLPLGLEAAGIECRRDGEKLRPVVSAAMRKKTMRWWRVRQRLGKAINLARLVRATSTFDGAARYAAWKIERHSGVKVEVTPWREKHPVLAAPGVIWSVWRERRKGN